MGSKGQTVNATLVDNKNVPSGLLIVKADSIELTNDILALQLQGSGLLNTFNSCFCCCKRVANVLYQFLSLRTGKNDKYDVVYRGPIANRT